MKCSVLLSAYCGSEFLRDQLDSIVSQTRLPDELIFIDDFSPDNGITLEIANEYALKYPWIKVTKNERNLGWRASFMHGIDLVSGDVICFCDQDDIWHPSKIELSMRAMESSEINVLIAAYDSTSSPGFFDAQTPDMPSIDADKFTFDNRFIYPKGVGAAMAVKTSFAKQYKEIWNEALGHDHFFQIMAVMFDRLFFLDVVLLSHRLHEHNATGKRKFIVAEREQETRGLVLLLSRLNQAGFLKSLSSEQRAIVDNYTSFATSRLIMLETRSILRWISMIRFGFKFYPSNRTWFGDLLAIIKR